MTFRSTFILAVIWIISYPAYAQEGDPFRFARWVSGDIGGAASGITSHRTAIFAGGMVGSLLLLSTVDRLASEHIQGYADHTSNSFRRVFHEVGNAKVVRPIAAIFFLGTLTGTNERLQDAAFTSLEAVVMANLVTNGLKLVVGRARPSDNLGPGQFDFFSGKRSFPSGHATTAFAFAVPWILYYPRVETYVLAGLALGTSFVRIIDGFHWLTDVLAGSMIGATTGYLLTKRHLNSTEGFQLSPIAMNGAAGVTLSLRF